MKVAHRYDVQIMLSYDTLQQSVKSEYHLLTDRANGQSNFLSSKGSYDYDFSEPRDFTSLENFCLFRKKHVNILLKDHNLSHFFSDLTNFHPSNIRKMYIVAMLHGLKMKCFHLVWQVSSVRKQSEHFLLTDHRFKQPCVSFDEPADLMAGRGPLSVNTACLSLMATAWKSQLAPCDYAQPENN